MLKLRYAWTPEDEAKLTEMAAKGVDLRSIALRLRRSESSVKRHANRLGLKVQRTARVGVVGMPRGPIR